MSVRDAECQHIFVVFLFGSLGRHTRSPAPAQAAMAKKSNPLDELNASAKHFTGDVKSRTRSGGVTKRA